MDYLHSVLKDILTEEARAVDVVDAIKKRYEVKITYSADNKPEGKGPRIIQPVAYGKTKAGNPVIRAFQPYGDTETKTPKWKFFRLDRITGWKPLRNNKFEEPPADEWLNMGAEGKYNKTGDSSMSEVFLVADFEGTKQRYERGGLLKYNTKRREDKIANDPLYMFKKNMEKAKQQGNFATIDKNVANWQKEKQKRQQAVVQNRGNKESVKNMQQAQNFGDETIQTVGPVTKNNTDTQTPNRRVNYQQAQNNGPVYKQQKPTQEKPEETGETNDITNSENNI